MVQVMIPSEKTKENHGKQGCQLEVTKVTLLKNITEDNGSVCSAGLARIRLAASTTHFTTGYSLGS